MHVTIIMRTTFDNIMWRSATDNFSKRCHRCTNILHNIGERSFSTLAYHHDNEKPSEEHHESGKADSIGAILSIECQVLRELDFTQLIDDFAN